MPKACLSCGTVNASNAKFCNKCGKPLPSGGGSGSSRRRTGIGTGDSGGGRGGGGKSVFCKECGEQRRVKGKASEWREPSSPVKLDWEEWEYYVLECNHTKDIGPTGRTKRNPDLDL